MNFKQTAYTQAKITFKSNKKLFIWILLFFLFSINLHAYEVLIEGIENQELLSIIKSASQLEKLKTTPPATLLGLKRRAEGDMKNILEALHSQAYYGAHVDFSIGSDDSQVLIQIEPGPIYPFASFDIHYLQNAEEIPHHSLSSPISLKSLGIQINTPALPETILSAEDTLLDQLNLQGFAFASIIKRDVYADQKNRNVIVSLVVETGPTTYFGKLEIKGLQRVKEDVLYKKLRWSQGALYNPREIEKTQEMLELSGLFGSVNITHGEELTEGNLVPMEIAVVEAKQRSVGFGLNYTTSLGPGFTGEWEDRNIWGKGQKLGFRTNLWNDLQEGVVSYLIPDFRQQEQNLIWVAEYQKERTKSFTENYLAFSGTIERKINESLRVSYGGMYKKMRSQRSDFNGIFDLLKIPLQLRWSNVDSILEPTKGMTLLLKTIPSLQMFKPQFAYCINTFTGSIYQALTEDKRHIFAAKLMLGCIFGANQHEIPPPERFYAGSESTIRGYRFSTISPIGAERKPLGGRSLFIYSMELRNRIGEDFGLVFFYDIGNVYKNAYPDFNDAIRQCIGLGIRYYTPIGPIRFDLAFPLNKRSHIDNSLEAYFSIGQSF
ncbi:MAG: autotransporter assembly complex family protein [Parachlamydiaceae bacterium]